MIYGVDISNHQAGLNDFGALQRDGFDFAIILSSDGPGFRNVHFARQLDQCRRANQLTAAYHYIRDASVADQIRTIRSQVPLDCPLIPDCEDGSGGVRMLRQMVDAMKAEGYRVPLTYLPQWYWRDHLGSPDLSGLPPLWISWYPDNNTRPKEDGARMLPAWVWNGYGGLSAEVAQFTSHGRLSGYPSDIDQNVYRGTREQLAALLGGEEEFLMALSQWQQERLYARVLGMSAGVEGENFDGPQFAFEKAQVAALSAKVDALGIALAKLAEDGSNNVHLDKEQLALLTTSVSDRVAAEVDEAEDKVLQRLDTMAQELASKLGIDKETVLAALKEFYRPVVGDKASV